ncbi:hypothetical protein PPERSA_11081 [Pseudocohnilembus persalinus]|uniref:Uncharacterized protein n=1 Tax=Pseudocohnilembus persalinus TaxID=266149 RepID=A0A0V0QYY6_PSEPJ|nr:hypothetical protein PPERSA_11081 [Pseudocohnilembus persalinus]|eukprot:KRX07532.1 hypothetical protein PPERSA_11081 [Pseudocohnilembus persalinus]
MKYLNLSQNQDIQLPILNHFGQENQYSNQKEQLQEYKHQNQLLEKQNSFQDQSIQNQFEYCQNNNSFSHILDSSTQICQNQISTNNSMDTKLDQYMDEDIFEKYQFFENDLEKQASNQIYNQEHENNQSIFEEKILFNNSNENQQYFDNYYNQAQNKHTQINDNKDLVNQTIQNNNFTFYNPQNNYFPQQQQLQEQLDFTDIKIENDIKIEFSQQLYPQQLKLENLQQNQLDFRIKYEDINDNIQFGHEQKNLEMNKKNQINKYINKINEKKQQQIQQKTIKKDIDHQFKQTVKLECIQKLNKLLNSKNKDENYEILTKNEKKHINIIRKNIWKNISKMFFKNLKNLSKNLEKICQNNNIQYSPYLTKKIVSYSKLPAIINKKHFMKFFFDENYFPQTHQKSHKQKKYEDQVIQKLLRILFLIFLRKDFYQNILFNSRIKDWSICYQQKNYIRLEIFNYLKHKNLDYNDLN